MNKTQSILLFNHLWKRRFLFLMKLKIICKLLNQWKRGKETSFFNQLLNWAKSWFILLRLFIICFYFDTICVNSDFKERFSHINILFIWFILRIFILFFSVSPFFLICTYTLSDMLKVTWFKCGNKAILSISTRSPSYLLYCVVINLISFPSLQCFFKCRENNSLYVKIETHPDCVSSDEKLHIAESVVKHEGLILFCFGR